MAASQSRPGSPDADAAKPTKANRYRRRGRPTRAKGTAAESLAADLAAALSERQRAYLLAVYEEDQIREAARRGPRALSENHWRWIEYGPIGAKWSDRWSATPLRRELDGAGLVDLETGATWLALVARGLVETKHAHTGFADALGSRPVLSLLVQMTADGRPVARAIKGDPLTATKPGKDLSLSALRLIAFGQRHPDREFEWLSPWEGALHAPDYLMMLAVARDLIKRGLLAGEAPHGLRIADAGKVFDVTQEPNWRPLEA